MNLSRWIVSTSTRSRIFQSIIAINHASSSFKLNHSLFPQLTVRLCSSSSPPPPSPPQPPQPPPPPSQEHKAGRSRARAILPQTFSWKSFGVSAAIITLFFGYGYFLKKEKELQLAKERSRSLGKASIGGTFDLVDQDGKKFTSEDLKGKWVLLYFGFSHCPDICPEEMEKMVKVIDSIDKMGTMPKVVPLFITVDPDRDSPEVVKQYIAEFSPKLIGLTGTKEQVHAATKAYRVYYSAGPKSEDNDYIVDHTIIMYLINPDGEFVDYYGQLKTYEQVTNGIALSVKKYESLQKKSWL